MTEEERALLQRSRNGDLEAWRSLIQIHAPRLAAYIGARLRRPEIVDKLVADTVYVAWKHLPDLEQDDKFASWLRRMGGSVAMSWYKRNHGEGISGEFPVGRVSGDPDASRLAALDRALGKLPEKERMALEQRFRAGLRGEELADVLHASLEDIDLLVDKSLEHLSNFMQDEQD